HTLGGIMAIVRKHGFSSFHNVIHRAAADIIFERALTYGARLFITRDGELNLSRLWVDQYDKPALSTHDLDHSIHDQAQHFIKLEGGVERLCNLIEGFQFAMLALEGDYTAGQHITLSLKVRWSRRS